MVTGQILSSKESSYLQIYKSPDHQIFQIFTMIRNQFNPFWGGNNLQFLRKPIRGCKWWVVIVEVKCLDYVNLISWYHDLEGQGYVLEIIISIRTWDVVVCSQLIVFICWEATGGALSYVFLLTRNILMLVQTHSSWSARTLSVRVVHSRSERFRSFPCMEATYPYTIP